MGLSKYETKYGISEKYDKEFREAEEKILPVIKNFHDNMNRMMEEHGLNMKTTQAQDPFNFEKLRIVAPAFAMELDHLRIKAEEISVGNYHIFRVEELRDEAIAIKALQTAVFALINSPEMKAMQQKNVYTDHFEKIYNPDNKLVEMLNKQYGMDLAAAKKTVSSFIQSKVLEAVAGNKKIAESNEQYAEKQMQSQIQLTNLSIANSKIKVQQSQRALNLQLND
jgi:hypothetical protein